MPRTRSLAWSELKIGVLTMTAVVIAVVTIFLLTGSRGFFWQRYRVKTRFDNVAGLKPGSPVRVAGFEVGSVLDVALNGEKVDVTLEINKAQRERITSRSTAKLGSVSLLGESAVDISPSTDGTPIPDWGWVPSGPAPAAFSDITDQASQGIDELTKLVQDLRRGKGTAGKLLTDDQLYVEIQRFVTTASDVTRAIQQGRGSIGRLITDPKVANSLEASLKNLEQMTGQINAGKGTLGKLMADDSLANALTGTTANLQELTGRLNRGEGTAGKLITDPALFNRLNSVADRFDQLMNRLNSGEGTAGQLLKDRQLYENMNGAVTELKALLAAIKQDPKKYLNVKVSIF